MRVITGTARGRRLKELSGMETRPTTDRVKEGLFSSIQFDIEGREVLDLFAGTGQLGIEALSRGAARCVFVEQRADALKLIRENLDATYLTQNAQVVGGEALSYLTSCGRKFDLIFLDPPYKETLLERAIEAIMQFDILREHGIIVCESSVEKALPEAKAPYTVGKTHRYGKIKVTLYRREGGSADANSHLSGEL